MLTPRQNLIETMKGGSPDRFVNQYECLQLIMSPFSEVNHKPKYGEHNVVNAWGVTESWPLGTPGNFPIHTPDKVVIKDITRWREYVNVPSLDFPEERWQPYAERAQSIDRNEFFATSMVTPGVFEQCHHLAGIEPTLIALMTEEQHMHDLIECITEFELKLAEGICKYIKPDALFHHDDWGSQISTFIAPEMFEEFYLPAYKQIYGYYKSHGVELIVHHSDSFAATLVPFMIDMGIDIWQGVISTNNIPELITKYGGQISFMGGLDNGKIDVEDWSRESIAAMVKAVCDENGRHYFIPSATMGGPESTFEGVYETITEEIDKYSRIYF